MARQNQGNAPPRQALPDGEDLLRELRHKLPPDFSGQIVLHCDEGRVLKYKTSNWHRPKRGKGVDLTE